jgi:hypothetical protein
MKKFDTVMVFGDSFCAKRNKPTDWPVKLGALLDCQIKGHGVSGVSWWSTRNAVLDAPLHNKSTTVRIVIHTETLRLPNEYLHPINTGLLFADLKDNVFANNNRKFVERAIDFYKSDLFSRKFYFWAQQAWIKELDEDDEYYATIHIPAFEMIELACVKNGIVVIPSKDFKSLRALSDHEIGQSDWVGMDSRSNHFSDVNNVNLAKTLASIISNLQPGDTGERNFNNLHEWNFDNRTQHTVETVKSIDFKSLR